jgi:hypothetical protein
MRLQFEMRRSMARVSLQVVSAIRSVHLSSHVFSLFVELEYVQVQTSCEQGAMRQDTVQGFSGRVEQIQLSDLVQLACLAQMNRIIKLESDTTVGSIYVCSGQVIHAETGDLRGDVALLEMLQWMSGRFEIFPMDEEVAPSIRKPWGYLLIEAVRLRTQRAFDERGEEGTSLSQTTSSSFSGIIAQIQLADLIQLICMTPVNQIIDVQWNEQRGKIFTQTGQVSHAAVSDLEGEEAFYEMFQWPEGCFEVMPASGKEVSSIDKPWEYLLIEAMRFKDEKSGGPDDEDEEREGKIESLFQRVQKMKVAEKIRLAITGDKEARTLLLRDANRLVQYAIISNPGISEGEVTIIANSKSVDDEILRRIADNREWIKAYPVRLALVKNPKTPLPIATKLIQTLLPQDLKLIGKSKAVPNVVALCARKQLNQKD